MTPAAMAALHARVFSAPPPWSEETFSALVSRTEVFAIAVAEGFALGRAVAGEAELLTLAVAPEARRRGIGQRLVACFLAEARSRGAQNAFLEVGADNAAARALYARAGFVPVGHRRAYLRKPDGSAVDAIVLSRPL